MRSVLYVAYALSEKLSLCKSQSCPSWSEQSDGAIPSTGTTESVPVFAGTNHGGSATEPAGYALPPRKGWASSDGHTHSETQPGNRSDVQRALSPTEGWSPSRSAGELTFFGFKRGLNSVTNSDRRGDGARAATISQSQMCAERAPGNS